MTSNTTRWALTGAGLGIALSAAAVGIHFDILTTGANAATETPAAAAPPAIPVTVSAVEPKSVTRWEEFSGRLEAIERVAVRSRVAGQILSAHFQEGGLVKAGDLLVTIDPAPYQAVVAQAEGLVASAQARLDFATIELARGKTLSANNTISKSDMAQRQSTHAEAIASLQSAKASLQAAELDLGYTQIRAPIAGRVGRLEISVGNLVAQGSASSALTTLVSVDPLYASFNVSEEMIVATLANLPVTNGTPAIERVPVEIRPLGQGAEAIRGRLQLIDNEIDMASGTIRVRAVFDNPGGKLIPGQFVRIRMGEPQAEDRLTVSERAIGTDQDKKFVLVVDDSNTATYREIRLGASIDGGRIVESGLAAGEKIIVNGLQRVAPGMTVDPQIQ